MSKPRQPWAWSVSHVASYLMLAVTHAVTLAAQALCPLNQLAFKRLLGVLLGRQGPVGPAPKGGIPVHVVQPNISEDEKHRGGTSDATLVRYAALSADPHEAPRLLLWPEGALERFLDPENALRAPKLF